MVNLEIELGNEFIAGVKHLAVRHYGGSEEPAISQVVQSALKMRLLSLELVEGGGNEIEEAITNWEFGDAQSGEQSLAEIRKFLFRRR